MIYDVRFTNYDVRGAFVFCLNEIFNWLLRFFTASYRIATRAIDDVRFTMYEGFSFFA